MSRRTRIAGIAALILFQTSILQAQTVTLSWDPNTESDLAGYRVFRGTQSGKYTQTIDVGKVTSYTVPNVDTSKPNFFAVQAYNTKGLSSALSAEVQWMPPATVGTVDLRASVETPYVIGKPVTWTASVGGDASLVEFKFWMFQRTKWVAVQEYSANNKFTWTPNWSDQGGPYHIQVWARRRGSTANYEAWRGTEAFTVMSVPVEVTPDVEFPTPPGNTVTWTAKVANADRMLLEYKFWVFSQATNQWTVFRDYAFGDQASWMPNAPGRYAVQVWIRRNGSTADKETWAGSGFFEVTRTPVQLTALTVDSTFPAQTGKAITWTAKARGGSSGPLQYQFWRYSDRDGWVVAQAWSPNKSYTWTPGWGDTGNHAVQVWARSNGSKAAYEDWRGTGVFQVKGATLHLTASRLFPVAPGTRVDWLADAESATPLLDFQFWLFSGNSGNWSVARPYGPDNKFAWTPASVGTYAVQVWARQRNSSNPYDIWRGSDFFKVALGPVRIHTLTSNVPIPAKAGTSITWTTAASGGTGPLEYQYWLWDGSGWLMVQDYSSQNTHTWVATQAGKYALQVWVRSRGSKQPQEAWMGTGYFMIQ